MKNIIQQLEKDLSKLRADIKAETCLSQAMEQGLTYDDFMVSCDSLFYRAHNKDIVYADIKEDARKLPLLQLHVSRSGLFDHLPQGLFLNLAPAMVQQPWRLNTALIKKRSRSAQDVLTH